jgi:hypothetical protein
LIRRSRWVMPALKMNSARGAPSTQGLVLFKDVLQVKFILPLMRLLLELGARSVGWGDVSVFVPWGKGMTKAYNGQIHGGAHDLVLENIKVVPDRAGQLGGPK